MGKYVDQFGVSEGWRFTEDISFEVQSQIILGVPGTVANVPITFKQSPLRLFQSVPDATHAFLVLRHLDIDIVRPLPHFTPTWQWTQALDDSFSAPASSTGANIVISFGPGVAPSGDTTLAIAVPLALRRIQLGTLPTGVTITKVEVKPGWASFYDNLHLTSPISGTIDLGSFYDSQYGLINSFMTILTPTVINLRLTFNNTNGTNTTVPFQLYGLQSGFNWAQWKIEYQPITGGVFVIAEFDDHDTPSRTIVMDKLIPLQITDTGQTNFGNLIFTANNQINWTGLSSSYNIMLTATMAYLVPD